MNKQIFHSIRTSLKHAGILERALEAEGIQSDSVARDIADQMATVIGLILVPTVDDPFPIPSRVAERIRKAANLPHDYVVGKHGQKSANVYTKALLDAADAIEQGDVSLS